MESIFSKLLYISIYCFYIILLRLMLVIELRVDMTYDLSVCQLETSDLYIMFNI